jgi:TrpR family trp operon transcriptional repressor
MTSLENIIWELKKLKSDEDLENFLSGILTPKEILELSQRIEIVRLLKKGMNQQDIAIKLRVGVATVTRGSREIQKGNFKTIR